MRVYMGSIHAFISYFCPLRRLRCIDTPVETNTQILTSSVSFLYNNQSSLDKWLILGLGQGIHKMNLGYLVMTESKEVLKKQKDRNLSKG